MICEKKLKAKGSKCEFAVSKFEYLSHTIENGTVAMDLERIRAVVDWPVAVSVKQLYLFLRFANYYNRFSKGCLKIIASLT